MSKITEEQLESMTVKERFEIRRECSENQDIESLLAIVKYHFIHGSPATNETNFPEMCYYYGRLQRVEELKEFLKDKSFYLMMLPQSSQELAQKLLNIGYKFPHLNESELNYVEEKYCNSETFELFDIIMFDKELLPRQINKFDKESLSKENKNFSNEFLLYVFSYFSANEELDIRFEKLYVYSRIENEIIRKEFQHIGLGEYCIIHPILSNEFWSLMNAHFGKECADTLIKKLCHDDNWEDYKNLDFYLIGSDSIEEVSESYFNDSENVNNVKALVALFWLEKINSQKINLT